MVFPQQGFLSGTVHPLGMEASLMTGLLSLCFCLEWERKQEQALQRRREERLSPVLAYKYRAIVGGGAGLVQVPPSGALPEACPLSPPGREVLLCLLSDSTWVQAVPTLAVCPLPPCIFFPSSQVSVNLNTF